MKKYKECVFYRYHTDLRTRTKNRWNHNLAELNKIPGDYPASIRDIQVAGTIRGLLKPCDSNNLLKTWQHEYTNYFKRLFTCRAAKAATAKRKKEKLEALLQQTKCAASGGTGSVL